ncbi:MAG: hypothetical protein WC353_01300 [Candidatus Peribacter sp.]
MQKQCRQCSAPFEIVQEDLDFYERLDVPAPTWCPPCREMRRMAWYTERYLYPGQCALCKKNVISQFEPKNPRARNQYCLSCWWSDKWDPLSYGRDYDPSRSFFAQLHELELAVPYACTTNDTVLENCDYTHQTGHSKNCYLVFHTSLCEDCYYGYGVKKSKNCMDVHYCHESELCYECVDTVGCYGLSWCQDCQNCSESRFIRDCIGCSECFLCVGLRNKKHCFLNEQLTPGEYRKRVQEVSSGSWSMTQALLKKYREFQLSHHWKCLQTEMTEDSRGNYLYRARDAKECYDCSDIEHSRLCSQLQLGVKFCRDIFQFGIGIELCYDSLSIGYSSYDLAFCISCMESAARLRYCMYCFGGTTDCFGCVQLQRAKFCILNKQYTEAAYRTLKERIIAKMKVDGEYGEFFPMQLCASGYNESTAQWWYPHTKAEATKKSWPWEDNLPKTEGKETLEKIPDRIADVSDDIVDKILRCEKCKRNYKVIAQELALYRSRSLPIPHRCFDCRRMDRFDLRNPRKLWKRPCMKCGKEMETTYPPSRPEVVYCEQCYLAAVY